MNNTGTLTLSIEIELAWGFHDVDGGDQYLSHNRERETEILHRLLALCDEWEIPISFDVVGHLLLDSCDGTHGSSYPNGWFDADPGTDRKRDPLFYARDLIKMIEQAAVDHEIGTHTFSHVMCDEVSDAVMRQELEMVEEIHERAGVGAPRSFVPPRHRSVSNKLLHEYGIETLRLADFTEAHPDNPARQYISKFTSIAPIAEPRFVNGVLETYCSPHPTLTAPFLSTGQAAVHPAYRVVPPTVRRRIHTRNLSTSLTRAIEQNSFVHHWTHLHNMANDHQMQPIELFLNFAAARRDAEECRICTMEQLSTLEKELGQ